jgi:bifunctional non-homologous end joining protein LigD
MVAFDLLYLSGYDLGKLPLIERKAHLKRQVRAISLLDLFISHIDIGQSAQHRLQLGDDCAPPLLASSLGCTAS